MEAFSRCGNWLVYAKHVEQHVFKRDKDIEELVQKERQEHKAGRKHSIHEVVISRGNNHRQNKRGVSNSKHEVKDFPERVLAHFAPLQRTAEESGVVYESHADAECVAEMHRGHRGELVDEFPAHPNALRVIVADCVEEAVLFGEQAWRHTGVDYESYKRAKVGEGKGPAGGCEGIK